MNLKYININFNISFYNIHFKNLKYAKNTLIYVVSHIKIY